MAINGFVCGDGFASEYENPEDEAGGKEDAPPPAAGIGLVWFVERLCLFFHAVIAFRSIRFR
jgi:hypothetical protein